MTIFCLITGFPSKSNAKEFLDRMTHKVTCHKPPLPQSVLTITLAVCVNLTKVPILPFFTFCLYFQGLNRDGLIILVHLFGFSLKISINVKTTTCVSDLILAFSPVLS